MHLPTAASGNGLVLATFGRSGELMGFFYPHIDYAQNIREGMFALCVPGPSGPVLHWCFSETWNRRQQFTPGSNVLVTELQQESPGLTIRVTDAFPPEHPALLRRFEITQRHPRPGHVLYQYLNASIGDVDRRNTVHWLPESSAVVQQFRDIVLAVCATEPFGVRCGTVQRGAISDVKRGMEHGTVRGNEQCIGDVDFAVGFDIPAQERIELTVILVGGRTRAEALNRAAKLRAADLPALVEQAHARSRRYVAAAPACTDDELNAPYQRAVLSLADLYDEQDGAFIAAPEFDSYYTLSGGYGYCWPRDAAHSALISAQLGLAERAERFFDWTRAYQLQDGHWFQRYWVSGAEAPAWCVRTDEIQLDQTCAVLHAAGRYARLRGEAGTAFRDTFRPAAERAAAAIIRHLDPSGLHKQAADLWECCYGSFAYTNAAVIAALREAREVFGIDVPDLDRLRRTLVERFYMPEQKRWARRIEANGHRDETADSSALGVIDPWDVLDLSDAGERDLARTTIEFVERELAVDTPRGRAILRFQHEQYMGGGPGCVNTLWTALCLLRLAAFEPADQRDACRRRALTYIRTALGHTNPTGQLPELIPNMPGLPYWAAPHAWASALFIQCVLQLRALGS
jgi:GH15 family glucan-1,4-alpha-glucosidase